MTQLLKVLAAKANDLNLLLRTHMIEGKKQLLKVVL